jgi:pyrroloquinoline-quinone synthase
MTNLFRRALDEIILEWDLLNHPFYKAWSRGELTKDQIGIYARDYYKHVAKFPEYLTVLSDRLEDGPLKEMIVSHRDDELGKGKFAGKSHDELWLDFAAGMGVSRDEAVNAAIVGGNSKIEDLTSLFTEVCQKASVPAALATLYAYESQTPRVAQEKAFWLKTVYSADQETCRYFTLHAEYDIEHSEDWFAAIEQAVGDDKEKKNGVFAAASTTGQALWSVLDSFDCPAVHESVCQVC